jgi:hypothetical protein
MDMKKGNSGKKEPRVSLNYSSPLIFMGSATADSSNH